MGGRLSRAVYLAPRPEFQRKWIIRNFITSSTSEIFSYKRYKLYFCQSEMLTSNVQLGYVLTMGGGQAVQGGLFCDLTRTISSGKAEFANVVEFVNVVRIFDNFAVPCRLNNTS